MANDILVKIGADITDFSRKMAESNKALSNFGKANAETFDAFKKTGAAVTGAGVALAGGLGIAVKTAANFEEAMSNVKAISGATGDEFNSLRDKAMEMGAKTAFSASESADAMANLAQMGWKTDDILAGIEHTLNLAAAGNLDLADAAMIAANTINQFGLEASDAERVADVMAATASSAGTDVEEMAHALQYAGANASAAGMDIEQTAAFIGVLGDAGITGSKAGTALNAMLRDLKKNAEDGALAVGEQTVALYDANGEMRPMPDVIAEIIRATEKMSDEQRDAALSTIFGEQALGAFNAIAGQGADAVSGLANELYNAGGTAQEMAGIQLDNLNGALIELSSAFEGMQISIGSALIPAIRAVAEWIKSLVEWFNGLSETTKQKIAIFMALTSILLIVGGGLLLLIGFIPQIIAGFAALKTAGLAVGVALGGISAPVLIVIGLIGALIAALVVAWRKSEAFREGVIAVFNGVKEIVSNVINAVVEYLQEKLTFIAEFWAENGAQLVEATQNIWNFIQSIIEVVMPIITAILQGAWFVIQTIVMAVWENIKGVIDGALNIILGLVKIFGSLFTGDWQGVWEGVKQVFKGAIQVLWNAVQLMLWGRLLKGVMTFAKAFGSNIASLWSSVSSIFTKSINAIRNFFTAGFNAMRTVSNTTMSGVRSVITTVFNAIRSVVSSVISAVVNTVRTGFTNVVSAIRSSMSTALSAVRSILTSMVGVVRGGVSKFANAGRDLIKGLINGIKNMTSAAIGAITGVVDGVVNKAKSLLKISSPSRVFEQIGAWTGEGLVDGMLSMAKEVDKASDMLAESAIPDIRNIDMSYATPDGVSARSLSNAVSGTVDVNSRDEMLVSAIKSLERRLTNLTIEMEAREVGRIVEPHVTENQERNNRVRKEFT